MIRRHWVVCKIVIQETNYRMALNTNNSCHIWGQVCKSVTGLKRCTNIKKKINLMTTKGIFHVCQFCAIGLKSLSGFKDPYFLKAWIILTMPYCDCHTQQQDGNHCIYTYIFLCIYSVFTYLYCLWMNIFRLIWS